MSGSFNVEIEATNLCNTVCLHCPHEAIQRPMGKMSWETHQRVIDQVSAYTRSTGRALSVGYAGMGEPLLNPLIYDFIDYAAQHGAETSVTTNASALTPKNIERLHKSRLSLIIISYNGDDKELYELMMGGLPFERAQQHLRQAVAASQGTGMQIAANVSVTRQTRGRLREIKSWLNEAGVQTIFFSLCHNRGGFLKGDLICDTPLPPRDAQRCDIFTSTLFVAWTGQVIACCHDLAAELILGDLNTDELQPILEHKDQVHARGMDLQICQSCNDLYRFRFDPTLDHRSVSEWVYQLYAEPVEVHQPVDRVSALGEWLLVLYSRTGRIKELYEAILRQRSIPGDADGISSTVGTSTKAPYVTSNFSEKNPVDEEDNPNLQKARERLEEITSELEETKHALQSILDSRAWRMMQRLQNIRLRLIPRGSRREIWLRRILDLLK